jgi:hypothetical protein
MLVTCEGGIPVTLYDFQRVGSSYEKEAFYTLKFERGAI